MSAEGWVRNPRYAEHAGCPRCRVPLVMMPVPVRYVAPRRVAADDEEVVESVSDGFKASERVRGWRHTATMRCPACGALFSPAQARRFDWRPSDLPADWMVRPLPAQPEDGAEAFAAQRRSLEESSARRRGGDAGPRLGPANALPTDGSQRRLPIGAE